MDLSSISFGMEEELGENNCSGEFLKGEKHRKHNHPMGGCVYDRRKMMDIAVNMPQYIPTFVSSLFLRENGILGKPRSKQIIKGEMHRKHNHPKCGCVYDRRKMMDIAVNMLQYTPTFV